MHPFTRLLFGYALLANSIAVMAQENPPSPPASSRSELQERLRTADANGDGFIDRQEAEAKLPRVAKGFDRLDTDDDDRLSIDELKAVAQRIGRMRR